MNEQVIPYAKSGEYVQIKVNIENKDSVYYGDVICHRDKYIVPVS
jgi:translation elongation factor EF-1alpha